MSRIRTSLRTLPARLVCFVVLPLGLAVGGIGLLLLGQLERQFERRMQEDVEMVARALQRPVSRALEKKREGTLRNALESAIDIGRVYGAHLYDEDGRLLTSLGAGDDTSHPTTLRELQQEPRGGGHYEQTDGETVYSYYVPVRLGGNHESGLLRITRKKQEIDAFMHDLRWAAGVVWLVLLLVMTLVVGIGSHAAAGASFARLRRSIERIRTGDRGHRAAAAGPQELRSVVHAFNDMLDATQQAERRAAQEREERAALQVRLAASERLASIGRLAAGIAHELGTPLSTVAGRVQRLLRQPGLSEPAAKELRDAQLEVHRLERLVREVLDFGRRDELHTSNIAARTLVGSARASLGQPPEHVQIDLDVDGSDDGQALMLRVDPARAEQALVNLLRNAVSAARSRVRIRCRRGDGVAELEVDDDGAGIPREHRERIFEPFFTTRGAKGTGLGLAIVAAVAHEHGGDVRAGEGSLGGAKLTLSLPLAAEEPQPHAARTDDGGIASHAG